MLYSNIKAEKLHFIYIQGKSEIQEFNGVN